MKDKLNLWDDKGYRWNSLPIPNTYPWLIRGLLLFVLRIPDAYPWPLILCPHSLCGYCQNSFTTLTNKRKDNFMNKKLIGHNQPPAAA